VLLFPWEIQEEIEGLHHKKDWKSQSKGPCVGDKEEVIVG
jgi:hypothetical protein